MQTRRTFIKEISAASAAVAVSNSSFAKFVSPADRVRIGIIGTGLRGQGHIKLLLARKDTDIVAICDVDNRMLDSAKGIFSKAGKQMPAIFSGDKHAYRKLLEQKNIDAVVIATPWEWHSPMILDSIKAGMKYIGTEVMLGITLQDHWDVVKAAENANAQVMMLENVCYRRDVMAVMNMVRQGVFGELIHMQGGYQHDLRGIKFNDGTSPNNSGAEFGEKGFSEARWRTNHSVYRNGDLYPTHGVGPIAMMANINRGNRFISLSSFDSKARGLHEYVEKKGGKEHASSKVNFKLGDIVTTHIKCANGETILLQHDTNLPRPYSLGFRVQGTNGLWMDVNKSVYVEGISKPHQWDEAKQWLDKYDHPLWKRWSNDAEGAGHGGMDFFVLHAFIESIKRKQPTPQDVYDAAAWSAITPLSERSIELGNETVEFPDFTSGNWMYRKNDFAATDEY